MAEATALANFEHVPLPDPRRYIRLLKVIEGHIEDDFVDFVEDQIDGYIERRIENNIEGQMEGRISAQFEGRFEGRLGGGDEGEAAAYEEWNMKAYIRRPFKGHIKGHFEGHFEGHFKGQIRRHIKRPVECEITTWSLDNLPSYCAISYTWGDPKDTTIITINQKEMVVGTNCEYVLKQAFMADAAAYLWVDAICIDQKNTKEKGHQVAMMGNMYKQAVRVLSCVGSHSADSDFLMSILESRKSFLAKLNISTRKVREGETVWSENVPFLQKPLFSHPGELRAGLLRSRGRIAEAIANLLCRAYFTRVWILQELALGCGKITICCGMDRQPLRSLLVLSLLIDNWYQAPSVLDHLVSTFVKAFNFSSREDWYISPTSVALLAPTLPSWKGLGPKNGCLALGVVQNQPAHLLALLDPLISHECKDKRDKIYGVKALMRWPDGTTPIPDYDKSSFDLATEVMGIILSQRPSSDGLRNLESLISTAHRLWKLFDLRQPSQAALERRRTEQGHDQSAQFSGGKGPVRRIGEVTWWGSKLERHFNLRHRERYTELQLPDGTLVAYASKHIQKDDWIVKPIIEYEDAEQSALLEEERHNPRELDPRTGNLILRASPDGNRHAIVSPTFMTQPYTHKTIAMPDSRGFVIWWDAEDLSVLSWRCSAYNASSGKWSDKMDTYIDLGVSATRGASFAMGPYTLDQIQAMLDDHDGLLEPQ